jgi:tetratricopeptide (TPR) repeat protein
VNVWKGLSAGLIVAVAVLVVAALPAAGQISGADQRFVDGLEKRGLLRLQQQFLDDLTKGGGSATDLVKEQQAKLYENQGARSGDEIERDKLFKLSKDLYRELLDQMTKAQAAATEVRAQDELKLRLLTMKVHVAELIWQREATNQLTNLELTDRQSGNKAKVQGLLREATALFLEINKEATEWTAQLQTDDKRMTYLEQADQFKVYSNYQVGWTSYYLAYVLPAEDKDREKLLTDAIARFTPFTVSEDDFPAKWESFKGLGMCYREQGKFEDAVKNLRRAVADDAKSPSNEFRISVYYEICQTYIKAKQFVEARQAIDEMRAKKYPKMEETLYGGTILPFIEAKILLAEGATDSAKKEQGLAAMRQLWDKALFWHLLVAPEVSKYIDKTLPVEKLSPFEIWIMADAAFGKADYKAAAKFFEQYVKVTPPSDVGHPQAQYDLAACYFKLADAVKGAERTNYLRMAANGFEAVAATYPSFEGASRAAKYAVEIKGMLAEADQGGEAVEDVAKSWEAMIKARPEDAKKNDAEWYLAQVRLKQNRFHEAADHFARVPTDSPGDHYYDALFMEIHSLRRDLWEVQWTKDSAEELKRVATAAVGKMEEYVKKAQAVTQPPSLDLKKKLRDNAAQALIWSGEILGSDKIQEYQRALVLLDRCEKEYGDIASKGDILKVKIDCHRGQGQLDKAREDLEGLLKTDPNGLQAIFQSLFASFTDEVARLIGNGQLDDARKKVAMADDIGKMFTDYLAKSTTNSAGAQIETVRAQLAELHLEAEDLDGPTGALERYKALLGYDPSTNPNGAKEINMKYLVGLAKAATALGRQQVDSKDAAKAPEAYDNFKHGVFYWTQVYSGYEQQSDVESQAKFWEARLAQSQAMVDYLNDLEQKFGKEPKTDYKKLVKDYISLNVATSSSFGGPALKIQWKRLGDKVGIAIP